MTSEEAFNNFLNEFTDTVKQKSTALSEASWALETKGSKQAAQQLGQLDQELNILFSDPAIYQKLNDFKSGANITSPELLRILKLLYQSFHDHQVPKDLIEKISQTEAELSHSYVEFRSEYEGKPVSENDLLKLMKTEKNIEKRKAIWQATKKVGKKQAANILKLVKLRNQKAHRLGYPDFYQMQLKSQEIDKKWLFNFLDSFAEKSQDAYNQVHKEIEAHLCEKFSVQPAALGPWAWSDPFCQEDPLDSSGIDDLCADMDLVQVAQKFFRSMGFDIDSILSRSDLFEREKKNQHAFCTHIDREGDIRILTNLQPSLRWLDTLFHELGHAVYEQGYDPKLPWLLKTPPHMITTEAIALIMGRCAYQTDTLNALKEGLDPKLLKEAMKSTKRRQLIFSRWVLVMVHFEANLYHNPEQDLNQLWWSLVQKYQKICPPSHRSDHFDWACKYHVGLAPVYYHSYLLGEFFASMLADLFQKKSGQHTLYGDEFVSSFLNQKLFFPGNRSRWDQLIEQVTQKPLDYQMWIEEFKP